MREAAEALDDIDKALPMSGGVVMVKTLRHFQPTRQFMIAFVRERGARVAYGPDWPHSDAETLRALLAVSDAEYARQCGCDHHNEHGNCLGYTL